MPPPPPPPPLPPLPGQKAATPASKPKTQVKSPPAASKRASGTGLSKPPAFTPAPPPPLRAVPNAPPAPPKRASGTHIASPLPKTPPVLPKSPPALPKTPPALPKRASGTHITSAPQSPPVLPKRASGTQLSSVPSPPAAPVVPVAPPPPPLAGPPPTKPAAPPVPQHSPKRRSELNKTTPPVAHPPASQFAGVTAPLAASTSIPPPPVLNRGSETPPPPPRRSSKVIDTPPPPPVRRDSVKRLSSTSSQKATENGYQDYDVPKPTRKSSTGVPPPQSQRQHSLSSDRDSDYDVPLTKGERLRKEKMLSMLAAKQRHSADDSSSDPSRPVSVNSSSYSADSGSLNSSPSGSKGTLPSKEDDQLQSSIDHELDVINQLVADVRNSAKLSVSTLNGEADDGSSNSGSQDNLGVWDDLNIEEDSDEQESVSGLPVAPSGSDEVLLDSWIKELESGIQGMAGVAGISTSTPPVDTKPTQVGHPPPTVPAPPPPSEPAPPPPSLPAPLPPVTPPSVPAPPPSVPAPPPSVPAPPPSVPAPPPPVVQEIPPSPLHLTPVDDRRSSGEDGTVVRRRKSSKTEKEMSKVETWRLSMRAIEDAEDPDLDLLLADLCKLEEDTKAQLASTSKGGKSEASVQKSPKAGGTSSDDFVSFMEGLQEQRNVVVDFSKISSSTYQSNSLKRGEEPPTEETLGVVNEADPTDIFSRESMLIRSNSKSIMNNSSSSSLSNTSSLRRRKKQSSDSPPPPSGGKDSGKQSAQADMQKDLDDFASRLTIDETLTPEQQVTKLKNEKLKIAMMKLKEASVHKMVLKVHNVDNSTKMVAIHEAMNARDVCILLAERNHQEVGPNWTLVEKIADLHLERTLEDHEKVLQCLTHWPRTHNNTVLFKNNPEKYYLLKRPQLLMPASHAYSAFNPSKNTFTEEQKKKIILKELFVTRMLPKIEGELHIREGKKSSWKKHLFVLRASGLYHAKSGRSLASNNIVRVVEWKDINIYGGNQYKKFYRAPGPYCFSLVPHGPLQKVEKQIVHLCASSKQEVLAWVTGIRLAKFGDQLNMDYEDTKAEMPWLQLEDDNLDRTTTATVRAASIVKENHEAPAITQANGKDADAAKKAKNASTAPRASFNVAEKGTPADNHKISGPMTSGGTTRKPRGNTSLLASAFQNAWKQGNLAAEMNQDTEKWPNFNQSSEKKSNNSLKPETSKTPQIVEETDSGMFTLRKKNKPTLIDSPVM